MMSFRLFVLFSAIAFALLAPIPSTAQGWIPPSTPDGHPDLQGTWINRSATPLERPKQLEGRQFLTDQEVGELKQRAKRIFKSGNNADVPNGDDFFLAALGNIEHYKRASATGNSDNILDLEFDNRTSLIVDPPDGRIPPYTSAGEQRRRAGAAAAAMASAPGGPQDLTPVQRCITWGIPMPRPGPFTSYYQIIQSPGYVVIYLEAIHDARIIPLDGRAHAPGNVRAWNGDSIGHWEGQTLVVDTTNFSPKDNFMGSAENLHLVERFSRVAADEIRYEMTVDDPTTWTKPWTAVLRLKASQDKLYEFACHEGNLQIMETMLSGPRGNERYAEEAAPKPVK